MIRKIAYRCAAPALLLVICAGFYWKLTLTSEYNWLDSPDIVNMEIPRFQFEAVEWHRHHFPLWDPHEWCGQPFLGQITGAAYPVNWLLAVMPLDRAGKLTNTELNWYFVFIRFLGALFCYWLCRDLKRSRTASILAGCVFAFGSFIGSTDWPQLVNGAVWAPLVFLFLLRAIRGERPYSSAALSGVFLGISWLSGHHEVPIYLTVSAGGVWLFAILREGRAGCLKVFLRALTAGLFLALAGAFQILPGYEYGKLAVRWAGVENPVSWKEAVPYVVHTMFAFTPASAMGILFPNLFRHVDPFLGLAAVSLVLIAVLGAWKQFEVRLFTALAVLALLFAMAPNNPMHGLLYAVLPVFGRARIPARFIAVFGFAVAPLVAYGIDAARESLGCRWIRVLIVSLASLGGLIFLILLAFALAGRFNPNEGLAISAVFALLAAGIFEAWRRQAISARAALIILPLLVIAELSNGGLDLASRYDNSRNTFTNRLYQNRDIVAFLKQQPRPFRVQVDDREISINLGDWDDIDTQAGFLAGVTENLHREEGHLKRTRDLYGVNYAVARNPTEAGQIEVFQGTSGLKVYRNPDAFPRAWAVHQVISEPRPEDVIPRIQDPALNLRETVLLVGQAPALEQCDASAERVTFPKALSANAVAIDAELSCRGMVVLSDTWYPGWKATVDGSPATIREAYGAIRGVVVDRGKHRIEMRYLPATAIFGGILSIAGVLGACLLAFLKR